MRYVFIYVLIIRVYVESNVFFFTKICCKYIIQTKYNNYLIQHSSFYVYFVKMYN